MTLQGFVSAVGLLLAVPTVTLAGDPATDPAKPADSYIVFRMSQPTARIELWEKSHRWPARYFTVHGDEDGLMIQKVDGGEKYYIRAVQLRFSEHSIFGSRFTLSRNDFVLEPSPGAATYFGDALVFPAGGSGPPLRFTIHAGDLDEVATVIRAHHPEIVTPVKMGCVAASGSRDAACEDAARQH